MAGNSDFYLSLVEKPLLSDLMAMHFIHANPFAYRPDGHRKIFAGIAHLHIVFDVRFYILKGHGDSPLQMDFDNLR